MLVIIDDNSVLRTCKGKPAFFKNKFQICTAIDFFKKMPLTDQIATYALLTTISEIPSNISTMTQNKFRIR